MARDATKPKKPKPFHVPCKGGPADHFRIEGGLEPPEKVIYKDADGFYRFADGVYLWVAERTAERTAQ